MKKLVLQFFISFLIVYLILRLKCAIELEWKEYPNEYSQLITDGIKGGGGGGGEGETKNKK